MSNSVIFQLPVLERFLAALEIGVTNFTLCDIRNGWSASFKPCSTTSLHYCMGGIGALVIQGGEQIALNPHSFVLVPAGIGYRIASSDSLPANETRHERLSDWPSLETVPTVHCGLGAAGVSTACGELKLDTKHGVDPFGAMSRPLIARFDGQSSLNNQFVLLLAEFARPGLGSRALVEALL
jgi:AraC family transcriptional regulator, activator of mtrCDE